MELNSANLVDVSTLQNKDFKELIAWSNPDVIIHCAALTNGNYCEQHPLKSMDVNGLALKKLADEVSDRVQIIYISTDAVFSNHAHLASEENCPNPESVYGKSKELGEFFLNQYGKNYTIIRTTIVGFNQKKNKQGFVEWIINSSKNKNEISLFNDVLFTPITCNGLGENILLILRARQKYNQKILHISGREIISKYTFGISLLKALGLDTTTVKKGSITTFEDRAKRSSDQSLNCMLFEKMEKIELPNLAETIGNLKESYHEFQ